MKKVILFCFCLGMLFSITQVFGATEISVGTHYMLNTNQERLIPIMVSSPTEYVEGLILAVQIGDGGAVNGGTNTAPQIADLDIIGPGTIFNASNTGSSLEYLGNLIAMNETTTASGSLEANGVLAWLTINPSGAALGSYRINLQTVGENVDGNPWTTDFAGVPASFPLNDGWIQIISLHQMKWNAASSGNWTNATWTGSPPLFPNYTADAVVDTPYTVTVDDFSPVSAVQGVQEAHSLTLSNGGNVTVNPQVTLSLSTDSQVGASSVLDVQGNLEAQNLILSGTLQIANGATANVADISGTGVVQIEGGADVATLTANSIHVSTLTVGSGGKVILGPPGASGTLAQGSPTPVPEPSTFLLLGIACLLLVRLVV